MKDTKMFPVKDNVTINLLPLLQILSHFCCFTTGSCNSAMISFYTTSPHFARITHKIRPDLPEVSKWDCCLTLHTGPPFYWSATSIEGM